MDTLYCSECGSASVRKRKVVFKSGPSHGSGGGRGSGVSFGLSRSARPRAFLGGSGWLGKRQSLQAQEAAPVPFWPAGLGLLFLYSIPEWGGWAWAGFVLSVIWLITAAVDRWMFHTEWVCSRCGEAFTPEVETEAYMESEPDPVLDVDLDPEPPAGEVVTLSTAAKKHLTGGKTCSICGEWFPHAEFNYGNRENRSYCQTCNREDRAAYAEGGREGARQYREAMRAAMRAAKWMQVKSGARG